MRVLGRTAGLALVLATALVPPGPATAAERQGFPLFAELHLQGSRGYRIDVTSVADIVVLRASSGLVGAEYFVQGRVEGNRLEASFGDLGHVAVSFRARRRDRVACTLVQRGVFRGRIRFQGERGYTDVDARQARGSGFLVPGSKCGGARASAAENPFGTVTTLLSAVARTSGRTASLSVLGLPGRGRVFVTAALEERRGAMLINRVAFAPVGGRRAFISSGPGVHPAFAYLDPPKPFAGSAVFEETGEAASSWTGNLSVWLPGVGRVPMAGPAFSSNLCRKPAKGSGCPLEPTVQRPLAAMAQGSGSQSHAFGEARLSWSRYLLNSASSAGSTP